MASQPNQIAETHTMKRTVNAAKFISISETAAIVEESGGASKKPSLGNARLHQDKRKEMRYVKDHIFMKKCICYQPNNDPKKPKDTCKCGRKRKEREHKDAYENPCQGKWEVKSPDCIAEVPTNAFGEVEFTNANVAKYLRLSDTSDMNDVMWLLTRIWKLERPNLLISVTGGAKHISMSRKLKDAFKQGLLKTAQSTGAWIVTGGTNLGVMKYVGEAVSVLQSSVKVVAFAIAPWGAIQNKRELTNQTMTGLWPAFYSSKDEGGRNVLLDTNHTHYLLVDTGTVDQFGTEIPFRGAFEKEVSKMLTGGGENSAGSTQVPVVSIVVEGGPGTLDTVKAAVDNATPVVILEGSGRAADLLAYAYNNTVEEQVEAYGPDGKTLKEKEIIPIMPDEVRAKLRHMVQEEFPEKDIDQLTETVIHCVMRRHLVVIFSLEEGSLLKDIDVAILHAIMKANKRDAMNQLKLALAWNRIDIAKEEIFIEGKVWDTQRLEDILETAVDQNKHNFVQLLMEHVHLGEYLTVKRLISMYKKIPENSILYGHFQKYTNKGRPIINLSQVGMIIQDLVGDFYNPLYLKDGRYNKVESWEVLGLNRPRASQNRRNTRPNDSDDSEDEVVITEETTAEAQNDGTAIKSSVLHLSKSKSQVAPVGKKIPDQKQTYDFDIPAREMFIWCVLMNRRELALLFFDEQKHALMPSLLAAHIFRRMIKLTVDTELIKELECGASQFEQIALGILGECYARDEAKAKSLLTAVHHNYGDTTPLQLAVEAANKAFIGHLCCQKLLNNIWYGHLDENQHWLKLALAIVCPPSLFCLIKYKQGEQLERRRQYQYREKLFKADTKIQGVEAFKQSAETPTRKPAGHVRFEEEPEDVESLDDEESKKYKLGPGEKCVGFFNAPLITFIYNCAFYLVFILLFSYMMLCSFHPSDPNLSWIEIVIAIWVITLFIEEIRQLMVEETKNFALKVRNYFKDLWNLLDVLTIILYMAGLFMRLFQTFHIRESDKRTNEILAAASDRQIYILQYLGEIDDRTSEDIETYETWTRIILCCALMTFIFRILHIFSVARILGPKLVMIRKMMTDLSSFIFILFVFILAFGVAQQSILYPNAELSIWLIRDVFRKAYWQMYGELFLEEIEGEQACNPDYECLATAAFLEQFGRYMTCSDLSDPVGDFCANNSTLGCYGNTTRIPDGLPATAFPNGQFKFCYDSSATSLLPTCDTTLPRCAKITEFVPVILAAYILLTQILMFNLLIAMFSYTFEKVQHNTDLHWMYQRYTLIQEYYKRPPVPPPFIIINHTALLLRWIYRQIQGCRNRPPFILDDFKIELPETENKQLALWEKMNFDEHYREFQLAEQNTMESQVAASKANLDIIVNHIDGMSNLPLMSERLENVERKLLETSYALNWIMNQLSASGKGGKPPLLSISEGSSQTTLLDSKEQEEFEKVKAQKGGFVHILCRGSPYPESSRIKRFPVKTTKVYWEIEWKHYDPIKYTAERIQRCTENWADKDMDKVAESDRSSVFKFNRLDGDIDRRSHTGEYMIDAAGYPLNPFGRTGLIGRGLLGRWGPTHAIDMVITRWKKHANGSLEVKKGKRVMEFLSVQRKDVEEWAIPGTMKRAFIPPLDQSSEEKLKVGQEAIIKKAFASQLSEENEATLKILFCQSQQVYQGYVDDPRNTDNAWIETTAFHVHDEEGLTQSIPLSTKAGEGVLIAAWVAASRGMKLYAGHNYMLQKVATRLDCYY